MLAQYRYDRLSRLDRTQDGPTGSPIEIDGYYATGNRTSPTNASASTTIRETPDPDAGRFFVRRGVRRP